MKLESNSDCYGKDRMFYASFAFCHFSTISSQFFAIYICIFHKPEVQTVILRCWTGLNHNWFQSYEATYYSASFSTHYRRVLLSHLLVFNLWFDLAKTQMHDNNDANFTKKLYYSSVYLLNSNSKLIYSFKYQCKNM